MFISILTIQASSLTVVLKMLRHRASYLIILHVRERFGYAL